jgi:hypothetical protein
LPFSYTITMRCSRPTRSWRCLRMRTRLLPRMVCVCMFDLCVHQYHTCVCDSVVNDVCRLYIYTFIHEYMNTRIHPPYNYAHTYQHRYTYTCLHIYIYTYNIYTYVHIQTNKQTNTSLHLFLWAHVLVGTCKRLQTCAQTHTHAHSSLQRFAFPCV